MKSQKLTVTEQELDLLIRALRTRMNHERDDDAYIKFMRLKDQLVKTKLGL